MRSSEEFPPILEVVAQSISSSMLGIVMVMERSDFLSELATLRSGRVEMGLFRKWRQAWC